MTVQPPIGVAVLSAPPDDVADTNPTKLVVSAYYTD